MLREGPRLSDQLAHCPQSSAVLKGLIIVEEPQAQNVCASTAWRLVDSLDVSAVSRADRHDVLVVVNTMSWGVVLLSVDGRDPSLWPASLDGREQFA